MKKQVSDTTNIILRITSILILLFILISCEQPFTPSEDMDLTPDNDSFINENPTETNEFSTQPALPAIYQSQYINSLDEPQTYIDDTCRYLKNRWNPLNSEPGTVVMVIAFKDITNSPTNDAENITVVEFQRIMQQLKDQGFSAITTKKFLSFAERNVRIPPRSVLLIQDGNHDADYFERRFLEYWNSWGWPVVNGWVSEADLPESIWTENVIMESQGWVDHQSQGVMSDTVLSDDSSKVVITRELGDSLAAFGEHYGKNPYAFIWPNGGFGLRPVQAARQLGYRIGFTSNSRGPVMFNWVPQADSIDPERPTFMPEGQINDPLMTLPRFPAAQARDFIDAVRATGEDAAIYAQENKAMELNYYEIVCRPTHGELPTP